MSKISYELKLREIIKGVFGLIRWPLYFAGWCWYLCRYWFDDGYHNAKGYYGFL